MEVGTISDGTMRALMEQKAAAKNVELTEEHLATEELSKTNALSSTEPPYTVHISEAGYRQLELSQQYYELHAASEELQTDAVAEAVPIDPAEEEEDEMSSLERLYQFIEQTQDAILHAKPIATKDTDDEKVAALEQMRQLKEDQEEDYRRQAEELQALAAKGNKSRNIVMKGMRDLTIMLESFKPIDADEKDKEKKTAKKDLDTDNEIPKHNLSKKTEENEDTPGSREELQAVGGHIRSRAFHVELAMDDTINRIYDNAKADFASARDKMHLLHSELKNVYTTLQEDSVSDEKKDETMDQYVRDGIEILGNMSLEFGIGLERMRNLIEIRRERHGNQHMEAAAEAQAAIGNAADQTVLNDLYEAGYQELEGETFDELAEHIHELLDERTNRTEETDSAKADETASEEAEEADSVKADDGADSDIDQMEYI